MEAAWSSETLVSYIIAVQHHDLEDRNWKLFPAVSILEALRVGAHS